MTMTVHDIYSELNRLNKANIEQDGLRMPKFIDNWWRIPKNQYPQGDYRFALVGVKSNSPVCIVAGFSTRVKMYRLEKNMREQTGCRYFFVCKRR